MALHKRSAVSVVFDSCNTVFLAVLCITMLYPLYFVFVASVSEGNQLMAHTGPLALPLGFSGAAYKLVFNNPLVVRGFLNSIHLVVVGTAVNILLTSFAAYVLSRKNVYWKPVLMIMAVVTLLFERGLVPFYLTVRGLGLLNSHWAVILAFAISAYNMIIMRTYFTTIPDSLEESAKIDGANDFTVLFRIILPVAAPVVATMVLFYGVSRWNGYFYVMIFLRDRIKFPIALILREILIANSADTMMAGGDAGSMGDHENIADTIKFATTVVATVPILLLYPFLQKYFVKGAMIGSVKG
ncbi:MAG: carbohydrate ABC transporter permease [Spirochaetaceae bacterium]|nr:carbohydrate ABC transporter permease [Spirochaetaceae bacterium]